MSVRRLLEPVPAVVAYVWLIVYSGLSFDWIHAVLPVSSETERFVTVLASIVGIVSALVALRRYQIDKAATQWAKTFDDFSTKLAGCLSDADLVKRRLHQFKSLWGEDVTKQSHAVQFSRILTISQLASGLPPAGSASTLRVDYEITEPNDSSMSDRDSVLFVTRYFTVGTIAWLSDTMRSLLVDASRFAEKLRESYWALFIEAQSGEGHGPLPKDLSETAEMVLSKKMLFGILKSITKTSDEKFTKAVKQLTLLFEEWNKINDSYSIWSNKRVFGPFGFRIFMKSEAFTQHLKNLQSIRDYLYKEFGKPSFESADILSS